MNTASMLPKMTAVPKESYKFQEKKEFVPRLVQLGYELPSKHRANIWTPVYPDISDENTQVKSTRCRKFRNLYEYNRKYKDKFNLKKNLWKIPNLSNNILPSSKRHVESSAKDSGLYTVGLHEPRFQKWYSRLIHENTVLLPPIQSSSRAKEPFEDPNNLKEKHYIAAQLKKSGPMDRFARDELHIPDVYSQCYTCWDCRKAYTSDVYRQTYAARNNASPSCFGNKISYNMAASKQHCDVLGERYCKSCIEARDKCFSRKIEDKLSPTKDLDNIHYNRTSY